MPLSHFDLPSVFARCVELGSAVVDGLPRCPSRPGDQILPRSASNLFRFGGVRGVAHACERLRQALTPADQTTYQERCQAIEGADCSPQAIGVLRGVNAAHRAMQQAAEQMLGGGASPSLDSPMSSLGSAARALWDSMSALERAGVAHLLDDARRIWDWPGPPLPVAKKEEGQAQRLSAEDLPKGGVSAPEADAASLPDAPGTTVPGADAHTTDRPLVKPPVARQKSSHPRSTEQWRQDLAVLRFMSDLLRRIPKGIDPHPDAQGGDEAAVFARALLRQVRDQNYWKTEAILHPLWERSRSDPSLWIKTLAAIRAILDEASLEAARAAVKAATPQTHAPPPREDSAASGSPRREAGVQEPKADASVSSSQAGADAGSPSAAACFGGEDRIIEEGRKTPIAPEVPASRVVAPDHFQHGHQEVQELTALEWRFLQVCCQDGKLRQAVPLAEVIGHVYRIDLKNNGLIKGKERALEQLRRRLQRKIDAQDIRLIFDLTNGFLRLMPF